MCLCIVCSTAKTTVPAVSSAGPTCFLRITDDIWKQKLFSFPTSRLTKQSRCTVPYSPLWCLAFLRQCNFPIVLSFSPERPPHGTHSCFIQKQYDSNTLGVYLRVLFLSWVIHLVYPVWTQAFSFWLSQVLLRCCISENLYLTRVNIYSGRNCKSIFFFFF